MKRQSINLTAEQLAALREFAAVNGYNWKSKLSAVWSTGRYAAFGGTTNSAALQQVRNIFGPSWLAKFSFDNVKTHSVKR